MLIALTLSAIATIAEPTFAAPDAQNEAAAAPLAAALPESSTRADELPPAESTDAYQTLSTLGALGLGVLGLLWVRRHTADL
jgi:MYXO-CTERM domain-containing protein